MMKTNKKVIYIAIAFICILVISVSLSLKIKDLSLAPANNQDSGSSSEVVSSTTELRTHLPFKYEETDPGTEEVRSEPSTKESTTRKVGTTTNPATSRKEDTTVNRKPSTTKPTTTKPSTTNPTTTEPTTVAPGKILYYYADGTTGYEPKPGAEYYSNGCWQIVSWGNTVTDEEIKDAHKNDSTEPWY